MTALPDIHAAPSPADSPRTVDGSRWLKRSAQRLGGAALMTAAAGLWVQPGASWDADVMLIKLGLSLTLGLAGLAVLQAGRAVPPVEVEIDTIRREVRLMRGKGRARQLVTRTALAELGPAEVQGNMVRLWSGDGALIAEVALTDPAIRRSLTGALRDADKL